MINNGVLNIAILYDLNNIQPTDIKNPFGTLFKHSAFNGH